MGSRITHILLKSKSYLFDEERKNDQDHEEAASQHPDTTEIVLDMCVIRIELGCARRVHKCRGSAYLPSIFLCHKNLLYIHVIASRVLCGAAISE